LFIVVHSARIGEDAKGEPFARPARRTLVHPTGLREGLA
jgi:hypothetical protein